MTFRKVLGAKLHRLTVTDANLDYEGSITIAEDLLEATGIIEYESVHIWNVSRGSRLETYAMKGKRGSGEVVVNGAGAHLVGKGDIVIVATYKFISEENTNNYTPIKVFVDSKNKILSIAKS